MTNMHFWFMIFMLTFFILIFTTMIQNNNPILLIIILVLYTLCLTLFMSMIKCNYIFSIIIFLMMISGLLIIFLYFTSLISNEQNKWKNNYFLMSIFLLNIMSLWSLMTISSKIYIYPLELTTDYFMMNSTHNKNNKLNIIKYIYSYPFNNVTILCILFLLLTLFIIIKICLLKTKSLRKIK